MEVSHKNNLIVQTVKNKILISIFFLQINPYKTIKTNKSMIHLKIKKRKANESSVKYN